MREKERQVDIRYGDDVPVLQHPLQPHGQSGSAARDDLAIWPFAPERQGYGTTVLALHDVCNRQRDDAEDLR